MRERGESRRAPRIRVQPCRWLRHLVLAITFVLLGASQARADPTINFDELSPGTAVTTQYADFGGAGQGVMFGPLPGGAGDSPRPVITNAGSQAHSGTQVADITCMTCNEGLGTSPDTTATFSLQRSRVSVYVGFLGSPALPCLPNSTASTCAVVTLRAFDASGAQVATSAPLTVTQGAGVQALLSVSSSVAIAGFEVSGRTTTDNNKDIAIDDLSFDAPATPPPPDFTLTPTSASLGVAQAGSASAAIAIGRLNGSSGPIGLAVRDLPAGVSAQFSPNPADGSQSTLTLTADSTAPPTAPLQVTIVGSPQSPSAGSAQRTATLSVTVVRVCTGVSTFNELVAALASCKTVVVDNNARIDLAQEGHRVPGHPDEILQVPDGVTLESGRSATVPGGLLYMSHRVSTCCDAGPFMLVLGNDTRVSGLRLRGYDQYDVQDRHDGTAGILIQGVADVVVDNNEIAGWPGAGISVSETNNHIATPPVGTHVATSEYARASGRVRITDNYFHNNVQCNAGYGVVVSDNGLALIDRNVFDFDRHDVAGGQKSPGASYIAELNFILTDGPTCSGAYNQHFDMHGSGAGGDGGPAGQYIRAIDSLTIATAGCPAASPSEKIVSQKLVRSFSCR